jgi:hypothetical protein
MANLLIQAVEIPLQRQVDRFAVFSVLKGAWSRCFTRQARQNVRFTLKCEVSEQREPSERLEEQYFPVLRLGQYHAANVAASWLSGTSTASKEY